MTGCTSRAEVARVESQREANRIVALLLTYGLDDAEVESKVDRRETSHIIFVATDSVSAARQVLAAHGLPREPAAPESGGSITPPGREEERMRVANITAESIRAELERLPGVTTVSVLVTLGGPDGFSLRGQPAATRISVVVQGFLSEKDGRSIGGLSEADFESLVTGFLAAAQAAAPVVHVQLCAEAQGPELSTIVEQAKERANATRTREVRLTMATGGVLALGLASFGFFVARRRTGLSPRPVTAAPSK